MRKTLDPQPELGEVGIENIELDHRFTPLNEATWTLHCSLLGLADVIIGKGVS